ncbi:MAG: MBL fold metallo-hydrolase [Clostridiales bacterium]|jgi:glyoxylase-like metal-dependent hydrolase (beta-lactamase superfamily II)|nr:MBL fold metallo-hydrolase [Clostridiales bacterium]
MKPIKITNRNIMFTEPMGETYDLNIGLILGAKHNFVIDTGRGSGSVAPVLEYIGDDPKPTVVINTHSHWDHVCGNHVFESGLIVSHTICRELIEKHWDEFFDSISRHIDGEARKCLPNLTFDSKLHFPEDGISLYHTPGHAPDGISIYDAVDRVLYAGDEIGDTDDEIVPHIGTDKETMQRTIEIFKQIDFDICISGHNKPQTKAVLARMETALAAAWKRQNEKG